MFARLEFVPTIEKKEEFINTVRNDVLPILKAQKGFLGILPFVPEIATYFGRREKIITISFWEDRWDAEAYERDVFPLVHDLLKPYVLPSITTMGYTVDATLFEQFHKASAA